ncbi:MAG: hypothetical protein HQ568_05655 [Calditrichaeota bacterium]|nr:hypothetical protein [Calditrichota bacterium]
MEKSTLIYTVTTVTLAIVYAIKKLIKKKKNSGSTNNSAEAPVEFKLKNKGDGAYQGVEYDYKYTSASQHNSSSFKLTVKCPCEGSYKLTKLTGFDRFFMRTGFSKDIRSGYPDFDDKFLVATDREEFAEAYFTSAVKRQAAIEIYDMGFKEIKCNGKDITVTKSPVKKKSEIDESLIEQVMEALVLLIKDIPRDVITRVEVSSNYKFRRVALYVVSIILIVTGFMGFIFGLVLYKPLDVLPILLDSLKFSLPLTLFPIWISAKLLRGKSTSHKDFAAISALFLAGFLLSGFGGEVYLNGYLDDGAISKHNAVITRKYTKSNKNGKDYKIIVKSWRENRTAEKFEVKKKSFKRIKVLESELIVTTKPGRFGFEWVVNKKLKVNQ